MSVVGVDLGTMNTVVAVARNRGVDVITNEVSNRATPSLVGFGPKNRYLGEAAKTQEISNLKNTVSSLKRLVGRSFKEADIQIEQQYISAPLIDVNGEVGAEVSYLGKKERFSATQLLAMFIGKIKQSTADEIKVPVTNLVLSVPAWFTDRQRRSLITALNIADLSVQRLLNDTTAAALGYGITKLDLPTGDEKPRRVMFVDVGHSTFTASVVEFRKGELTVKGTAFDRHYGGRDFDKAIVDHFQREFVANPKLAVDINTNARARARVLVAAEKLKKILSANQTAPLNIEMLMEDKDVSTSLSRADFESLVEPLLSRTTVPLMQALADAGLSKEDIDIVEVVGGGARVPAIKERIQEFFGKPLSFTLNQDEAVARGCAFASALQSPIFRVREFAVHDVVSYPIEFTWEKANDIPDEEPNLVVFGKGNAMPSTKVLTFFRKRPFDLEARYYEPQDIPAGMKPWIARFSVKGVKPTIGGPDDYMTCKLRARVNPDGVLNLDSAYSVEDQEVEEEIKEEEPPKTDDAAAPTGEAMDTDAPAEEVKPKTRKVRKQVRKDNLPVVSAANALEQPAVEDAKEKEGKMTANDKLVFDTEEMKNSLESYIYDVRDKLTKSDSGEEEYDGIYVKFSSDSDREKILAKLTATQDWLEDDGYDTTMSIYRSKKEEISALVGPIHQRWWEQNEIERQKLAAELAQKAAAKKATEEAAIANNAANGDPNAPDAEMTDADPAKNPTIEEVD
ncbi:heat shock 70kDa protein 4 [Sporothrix schenckii 1099-18]|uniref:Heat shock 70kDa protein 4 n=1 Tax=Sporothrix schenckii 1099-18 TaxID=1397361 RepID=A0A0F2LU85_SPOSC|nr:heat shock 70kDa protein 4 [Sporothrix schenckii 1099-18]KJR80070.1 heat shock 70kDa protein 4 [Sporothrix schenckii 1099-18]